MGVSLFKSCSTNYTRNAPAPNPDPKRWELLDVWPFPHAYVLKVKYLDATNYEGVKIMVYRGKFPGEARLKHLDPHFQPSNDSPVARFRPDEEGITWAKLLAASI